MDDKTRLWLPSLALSGCVRGVMLRDTHGRDLTDAERHTYFPASLLVSLLCWRGNAVEWLSEPGFVPPPPGFNMTTTMLSGPFTLPSHMRACGPVQGTQLLFFPDAFQMLTGIDVQALVNQSMPAERVLPSDWRAWANALQAEGDDEARLALIEGFLLPRWQAIAPHQRTAGRRYAEWAEALAVRAATSSAGRSLRQIERRVKTWAGLPMRELRAVSRAERAFLAAMSSDGPVNWAELAADTDYADQSHLCRETRRMTGFSPDDLRRRIVSEEAFWAYRLWS